MRRKREPKNSGLLVHWPVIIFGSSRRKCGRHIKLRKKYRKCWRSSLAIATASGKGIAVSWTASRPITRQVAVSASGRHSSPPKCIASRNRRRRFGGLSLKGHGPARGVQTNDCDKSSPTSTKPKKGNTNEDKTNSRKHHCVSHIVHDAHGGSNANACEHT